MLSPEPAAFPIDALGPDVAALFRHLECAVCLELQSDMVVLCESGHSVCAVCCASLQRFQQPEARKCPTCREPIVKPRPNLAVNGVVSALGIKPRDGVVPTVVGGSPTVVGGSPTVVVAAPVAVEAALPVLPIQLLTRRSLVAKLKVRMRKFDELERDVYLQRMHPASYESKKQRLFYQVRTFGREWRAAELGGNTRLRMPEELQNVFMEGFYPN